ncbi:flagellar hook-basal body complex protein FliE [Enterococcus sp. DIV2402]|jgi:flagellar hook-basal body complex protein FliE|uniref:Flagellar hook-basal body complex protein FliE n=1 Tax=Candidatus Enterococcus lowellii TaxID=2230877 RepID=A0ABZ2SL97_9ENTE|nr:flagellar hook-basal body complex protein FliE [Enterococcus sp. DIV2402]MBO0465759.1 flagellar hook-basal body complex protein FliE [Enterococcus sp. DIV2402]
MNTISNIQGLMDYQNQLRELQSSVGVPTLSENNTTSNKSFGAHLGEAIAGLNQNMNVIDSDTTRVISGDENDLAKVMINMTEAQLSLQTAVQVRNKCLEAYNDIKNMQF